MAFTYFFRDLHTLQHITRKVIPVTSGRSRVRLWDAGCAMGQEAYSLAIILAENMGHFAFKNLRIFATDIDGSSLFEEIIKEGVYPEVELKRIPRELFKKYFESNGKEGCFRIIDKIRTCVSFQKHDLLSLKPIGENFSLILCKNVLLHFHPEERVEVIKMFHQSLDHGGFLATEQTQKLPKETERLFKRVTADAQLFRKIEAKA
ncbi:Chemotaxis protein methyltransferase 1 [subsurface metagenome]